MADGAAPIERSDERIVVTGSAGFGGSHPADRLRRENTVVTADDLSNGRERWIPPETEFVDTDLTDRDDVAAVIDGDATWYSISQHGQPSTTTLRTNGVRPRLQGAVGAHPIVRGGCRSERAQFGTN